MDRITGFTGLEHSELTESIIGCAYRVFNAMGFGYLESVYERCLLIELEESGIHAEYQVPIPVEYRGRVVGKFVADVLFQDTVIVELKSVRTLERSHEMQLVSYLVSTGKPVGLLINFGETGVQVKRKVRQL